jgi:hypothetical protein
MAHGETSYLVPFSALGEGESDQLVNATLLSG